MKAVVYQGPGDVAVADVPDARIEDPNDILVRITTTNICGSDLLGRVHVSVHSTSCVGRPWPLPTHGGR